MNVWIRRLRLLFAPLSPLTPLSSASAAFGERTLPAPNGAPPITDLDLLRALGCDV